MPVKPRGSRTESGLKLRRHPLWSRRSALVLVVIMVVVGVMAVISARAAQYTNVVVSIGDINGGFYNGLVVTDPNANRIVGTLAGALPQLAGCPVAQDKAYISDLAYDSGQQQAWVSLKACAGGSLADGQALGHFDVASLHFVGTNAGPGGAARLLANINRRQILALSADGRRLQVLDSRSGRLLNEQNFSASEPVTRWAINPTGDGVLALSSGRIQSYNLANFVLRDLVQTGLIFPANPSAPDSLRAVASSAGGFLLGVQAGNPVLVQVTAQGQVSTYPLVNQPMSLVLNPAGDHVFIVAGCPAGVTCTQPANRLYAFDVASHTFMKAGAAGYVPLQTQASQIRTSPDGQQIYFDGVVVGSNGIGQRFLFILDPKTTSPNAARVGLGGPRWEVVSAVLPANAPGAGEVVVNPGVESGGGVGGGAIQASPVPLDEIERLLGVPLSAIDWSKVSDDQIRAFGYDPATVRRYIAQYQLQAAQAGGGAGGTMSCGGLISSLTPEQIRKIEAATATPISQLDPSKITDAQIKALGFEPSVMRQAFAKQAATSTDTCANLYTQDAFVLPYNSSDEPVAGGVRNLTVQPVFDFFAGGWQLELRWQVPGGAAGFHIFGRNTKQTNEQKLATAGRYVRSVRFGAIGQRALPLWQDDLYTLAVVPQNEQGNAGTPTAVKVRVRCYVVLCAVTSKGK